MTDSRKVALIVGAVGPLGLALAQRFAAADYIVYVVLPQQDGLADFVLDASLRRRNLHYATCNFTAPDAVVAVIETIEAELGPIHIAIYAGAFAGRLSPETLPEVAIPLVTRSDRYIAWQMGIMVGPHISRRRQGALILIDAMPPGHAVPGLRNVTRRLAREFGPQGVSFSHIITQPSPSCPATDPSAWPDSADIAETCWHLQTRPASAWAHTVVMQPWTVLAGTKSP